MNTVLVYIPLATSIILLILYSLQVKRKQALERELSSRLEELKEERLKNFQENEKRINEINEIAAEAKRQADEYFSKEKDRLEEEMRLKRLQNDAEIALKQQQIDIILQNYKSAQESQIALTLQAERDAALQAFEEQRFKYEDELLDIQGKLIIERAKIEQLRRNQIEVTEALMRKAVERDEHHISFTEQDAAEIKELQGIAYKYSRIRSVILKAIYDIYYAPEVKKLIARVVGKDKVCGIYRITSRIDGRIYVGKAVDIASRWQTHFKRAAGVETETQNLLYPAMRKDGLDQFSFEILEKVEHEDSLREREVYWQEFYDAKSHGFSVR